MEPELKNGYLREQIYPFFSLQKEAYILKALAGICIWAWGILKDPSMILVLSFSHMNDNGILTHVGVCLHVANRSHAGH